MFSISAIVAVRRASRSRVRPVRRDRDADGRHGCALRLRQSPGRKHATVEGLETPGRTRTRDGCRGATAHGTHTGISEESSMHSRRPVKDAPLTSLPPLHVDLMVDLRRYGNPKPRWMMRASSMGRTQVTVKRQTPRRLSLSASDPTPRPRTLRTHSQRRARPSPCSTLCMGSVPTRRNQPKDSVRQT